jgi:branched-chain amino acid transport system ATP-binding protein
MSAPLLEVESLSAMRGESVIVRDLSFRMDDGEVIGLLGANGAGKTTLVDAVCGFARKSGGHVRFRGQDITRMSPYKVARQGLIQVSQDRELFGPLTVQENLELGAESLAKRQQQDGSLERVFSLFSRLQDRADQRADSLSGGEQQMLAIGRALMGEPAILILDEPTSGLAPVVVNQVGDFLAAMRDEGLSILLVEQNVNVALRICDRFIVIRSGEVVFEGTREDLGDEPVERLSELYV